MLPAGFVELPIPKVEFPVCLRNLADNPARISRGNYPVWNIFCHYASSPDHRIAPNMDSRADYGIASDPHVIPDGHFYPIFIGGVSSIWMHRMARRINRHIGGHLAVISNRHFRYVQNCTVIIGKKIFSHLDMAAIITVKRRIHKRVLRLSQQFLYNPADRIKICSICGIQCLRQSSGLFLFFKHFLV